MTHWEVDWLGVGLDLGAGIHKGIHIIGFGKRPRKYGWPRKEKQDCMSNSERCGMYMQVKTVGIVCYLGHDLASIGLDNN